MPRLLLSLFTVSYFLHLTSRFPTLGEYRLDLLLGTATLLSIFLQHGLDCLRLSENTSRRLNFFLLYIFLSLPFVTWPGSVIKLHLLDWIKVALFYVLVVGAIRTDKQLRLLLFVFLTCQVVRVLEPFYLHLTTGYWGDVAFSSSSGTMTALNRLSGAPHDIVNANQLAWVIVTTVPFVFYLIWPWGLKGKLISAALLFPSIKALMLTGSRSGLLSLGAVVVGMLWFSKEKLRNFIICFIVLIPLLFLQLGQLAPELRTRYLSLVDSTVAGADTAQGRVNALIKQVGTIINNPLFGNGLGTSRETNWNVMGGSSQITHNLYIEILQETGIIGLSLFIIYIFSIIGSLRNALKLLTEKNYSSSDWLARLTIATLVWIFMNVFYSLSCFGLSSWEWYFFGGIATICHSIAQERTPCVSMMA
jgi:O-antigen ligase